ncbi:MAG TPA: C13 family peptidase [Candidatus Acidoferrales bacterium]|nr:C13 family peptidase [Candidatus Acidoferrales bacterium]
MGTPSTGGLAGVAFLNADSAVVLGRAQAPPAGASPAVGATVSIGSVSGKTDGTGAFTLQNIPAGLGVLHVATTAGPTGDFPVTVFGGATANLGAPRMTRAAAVGVVMGALSSITTDPQATIIIGPQEPLPAGTTVAPVYGDDSGQPSAASTYTAPAEQWFIYVDPDATARFQHPVEFFFVDAATGELTKRDVTSWPIINGLSYYGNHDANMKSPDLLSGPKRPSGSKPTANAPAAHGLTAVIRDARYGTSTRVLDSTDRNVRGHLMLASLLADRTPFLHLPLVARAAVPQPQTPAASSGGGTTYGMIIEGADESDENADIQNITGLFGHGGIPPASVRFNKPSESVGLNGPGRSPRMDALKTQFEQQCLAAGPDDTLFVYITAHGITPGKDGVQLDSNGVYKSGDPVTYETLTANSFDFSKCRPCRIIIIIDACYSGKMASDFNDILKKLPCPPNYTIISATDSTHESRGYYSWDWRGPTGGFFTNKFISAFNDQAASSPGGNVDLAQTYTTTKEVMNGSWRSGVSDQAPQIYVRTGCACGARKETQTAGGGTGSSTTGQPGTSPQPNPGGGTLVQPQTSSNSVGVTPTPNAPGQAQSPAPPSQTPAAPPSNPATGAGGAGQQAPNPSPASGTSYAVPQDSAGAPTNTCQLSYASWQQQQRDFEQTYYGAGTYNDNASELNKEADYLDKQAAYWQKFAEHTLSVARGYDALARQQLDDNRPEDAKSSIAERDRLGAEAKEEFAKADELSKEAADLRARAKNKQQSQPAAQAALPAPAAQPAPPCPPPEKPALSAGGNVPGSTGMVKSPIVSGGLRYTDKDEFGETRVADYDANDNLVHETFYSPSGRVIGETIPSQTTPGGYTTTYTGFLGGRTVTEWSSTFEDESEYDGKGVLRWRDRSVYNSWSDYPTYEVEEGFDAQGHIKYRDIYDYRLDGTTTETYQDFNADGTATSRTIVYNYLKDISDITATLTADQLNAIGSSLQDTLSKRRASSAAMLSPFRPLPDSFLKPPERIFSVGGNDFNLKLDFKLRLSYNYGGAAPAPGGNAVGGGAPQTGSPVGAGAGVRNEEFAGGITPVFNPLLPIWAQSSASSLGTAGANSDFQVEFTDTLDATSEGVPQNTQLQTRPAAAALAVARLLNQSHAPDSAQSSGYPQLVAYHSRISGVPRAQAAAGAQSPPAAQSPANSESGDVEFSIVSNGKTGNEALQLQLFDPSGRLKDIRMPPGIVLEPVQQSGDAKSVADRHPGAAGVLTQQIGALCLNFIKLPPEAGALFRIAPQAMQEKFKPLRSILQAGHSLADNGQLHPDSDPKDYAAFIRQYALWTKIENWDAKKFTDTFLEQSKKNAEVMKVPWAKGIENTLLGLAPGRWTDITAVLSEAEKISKASPATPAD